MITYIIETSDGYVGGNSKSVVHYVTEPEYAFVFLNLFQARAYVRKNLKGRTDIQIIATN